MFNEYSRKISVASVMLLVGCSTPTSPVELKRPDEVLRLSAMSARVLSSVNFDVKTDFEVGMQGGLQSDGSLRASGRMNNGGTQLYADIDIDFDGEDPTSQMTGSVRLSLMSDGPSASYFKLESMDITPEETFFFSGLTPAIIGHWWQISSQEGQPVADIAPDPNLLRMQAESVTVLNDMGIKTMNGRSAYHYDVTIDEGKFMAFMNESKDVTEKELADVSSMFATTDLVGEAWIDAETFHILRLKWDIASKESNPGSGSYRFLIDASFADHNNAEQISIPKDFKEFTVNNLMQYGNDLQDTHSEAFDEFDMMSAEEQEMFIRKFVDENSVLPQ